MVVPEMPGVLVLADPLSHKRHTPRSSKAVDWRLLSLFFTSEETEGHDELRPR